MKEKELITETETVPTPEMTEEQPVITGEQPMPEETAAAEMPEEMPETVMPEGEMTSEEAVPGSDAMAKLAEIIKKYYPDADTETPEALIAAALPFVEKLDVLQTWINESIDNEVDPNNALGMLADIKAGKSWGAAILNNFDMEELSQDEGADMALETRKQKKAEMSANAERWAANEIETGTQFIKAAEEIGLSEEEMANVAAAAGKFLADAADRMITVPNWKIFMDGARFETVVSAKEKEKEMAYEDGTIAGRNQKIEKKRMSPEKGDGLPRLSTSGAGANEQAPKKKSLPVKKEFRV